MSVFPVNRYTTSPTYSCAALSAIDKIIGQVHIEIISDLYATGTGITRQPAFEKIPTERGTAIADWTRSQTCPGRGFTSALLFCTFSYVFRDLSSKITRLTSRPCCSKKSLRRFCLGVSPISHHLTRTSVERPVARKDRFWRDGQIPSFFRRPCLV